MAANCVTPDAQAFDLTDSSGRATALDGGIPTNLLRNYLAPDPKWQWSTKIGRSDQLARMASPYSLLGCKR